MGRVGDKNGTGTDKQGTLTDPSNNQFTLSQAAAVAGVHGFAVNKGGVDTSFPLNRCSQLYLQDGVVYGKQIKGGWLQYNGTAWVPSVSKRDF